MNDYLILDKLMRNTELVQWFRQSTPYVNIHRGKTFVIMLDGDTLASKNFVNIISDINLLHSLGIKLILVFGARLQINHALQEQGITPIYHKNIRITDPQTLKLVKQIVGGLQYDLATRLSIKLSSLSQSSHLLNVISGNFVIAQPIGVDDGVDYMLSGKIRRIDVAGIQHQLDNNAIVLISPIAVSLTGEIFNLPFEEIASEIAIKINAEKLIGFGPDLGIRDAENNIVADLLPQQANLYLKQFIEQGMYHCSAARFLQAALAACYAGVKRSHLLSYQEDGTLLQELFSRDGIGTQLSTKTSEHIRTATLHDIPGILELIHPLEQQQILVKRSREQLEIEIKDFTVIDRDRVIIACASLHHYAGAKMAEMACVAVHPAYRNSSRGDILLENIIKQAKRGLIEKIFVLTTKTVHWFQERGFVLASIDDLPIEKREHYNHQRRSKILIKTLE